MGMEEAQAGVAGDAPANRRSRVRLIALGTAVVVVAGIAVALLIGSASYGRTSPPPWPVPADTAARVKDAGLGMLAAEGTVLHIHQHLSITVDGTPVTVPARIGILVADGHETAFSYIHTHNTSGVLHVESPVKKRFFLGQAFTEWNVHLAPGQVGPYRDGHDGVRLALFVDRKPYTGDPTALVLTERQDLDFVITTDGSAPEAPATAYPFPSNY